MLLLIFLLSSFLIYAQELELTTKNIQAYAQIKNCVDFTTCVHYEEKLQKLEDLYRWKVKFNEPLENFLNNLSECRINHSDFTLLLREVDGKILTDFNFIQGNKSEKLRTKFFPMELREEALISLKRKEPSIEYTLKSNEPLPALKSAVFEFEYSLEEYMLKIGALPQGVLGRTHHLLKNVTYDLSKWDGRVCRFYQVMRHEVQHVKNVREIIGCGGEHHFVRGKNDDISAYVNDLAFINRYCPEEKALYQNVETILMALYEGRPVNTGCSEGAPHDQSGTAQAPRSGSRPRMKSALSTQLGGNKSKGQIYKFSGKLYKKGSKGSDPHPYLWKFKRSTGNEPLPQKNPALR